MRGKIQTLNLNVIVVQIPGPACLFATPWTAECQVSLSFTISQKFLRFTFIWVGDTYLTISSSAAFSFCFQSFPASKTFPMSQFFISGDQNLGVSASASVFLMNIQDWLPLRLTGLISLQSRGLLRVFSSTTVWKH